METRVTVISDTHCRHGEIDLPAGDLLIHCGDMFDLFSKMPQRLFSRTPDRIAAMDAWLGRQRFDRILCIGGNHDRELETALGRQPQPFRNAHFLHDETVDYRGLKIHGASWVPFLPSHAFFKGPAALADAWALVPPGIDILVTHTPPQGILDASRGGQSLGCPALADELPRIAPRVHCFGHVHASVGQRKLGDTLFINAASIESGTGNMLPPVSFTLTSHPS